MVLFFSTAQFQSFDLELVGLFSQPEYFESVRIGPEGLRPTGIAALCSPLEDVQTLIGKMIVTSEADREDVSCVFLGAEHLWQTKPDYLRKLLEEFELFLAR